MVNSPVENNRSSSPAIAASMSAMTLDTSGRRPSQIQRKPIFPGDSESRIQDAPSSPVRIRQLSRELQEPFTALIEDGSMYSHSGNARPVVGGRQNSSIRSVAYDQQDDAAFAHRPPSVPNAVAHARTASEPSQQQQEQHPRFDFESAAGRRGAPTIKVNSASDLTQQKSREPLPSQQSVQRRALQRASQGTVGSNTSGSSDSHTASSHGQDTTQPFSPMQRTSLARPNSSYTLGADLHNRGRSLTPQDVHIMPPGRRNASASSASRSPNRPMSYVDLTMDLSNATYAQQVAHQSLSHGDAFLKGIVGNNASLLDRRKTLDMYRANLKKTNDLVIQYEFALFMIATGRETAIEEASNGQLKGGKKGQELESVSLIKEARTVLQRLTDKGYPYAQYYLADGYASGFFSNGKQDDDKAFPLFVAAGKHGHMEANYRAALCYEFGWGCRKDFPKAQQFLRQAASKGHPGAASRLGKACLTGDMGLGIKYKDGVRWLKRGAEAADEQHNSAPFELGLMHINGYGDDVFKDEAYAAQLLTQAAKLGHPMAMMRMGEAYEHGMLTCPRDAELSLHFYTGAAEKGLPDAMMALCAWYMIGAEPTLPKDEAEAYEWAKKAAETGMAKAEYAVGYFTEMGMGCRRDALEANKWYVRAADQGDERAKQRLAIIRAAESGDPAPSSLKPETGGVIRKKRSMQGSEKSDEKECIVM